MGRFPRAEILPRTEFARGSEVPRLTASECNHPEAKGILFTFDPRPLLSLEAQSNSRNLT